MTNPPFNTQVMRQIIPFTHKMKLNIESKEIDVDIEIDSESDINTMTPIPLVKEIKITPMDGDCIFYYTNLFSLTEAGYSIEINSIKK